MVNVWSYPACRIHWFYGMKRAVKPFSWMFSGLFSQKAVLFWCDILFVFYSFNGIYSTRLLTVFLKIYFSDFFLIDFGFLKILLLMAWCKLFMKRVEKNGLESDCFSLFQFVFSFIRRDWKCRTFYRSFIYFYIEQSACQITSNPCFFFLLGGKRIRLWTVP